MHTFASNREEKSRPDENKHPDLVFETVGVDAAQDQDFLLDIFYIKRF